MTTISPVGPPSVDAMGRLQPTPPPLCAPYRDGEPYADRSIGDHLTAGGPLRELLELTDPRVGEFQSIRLNGTYTLREWLDVNGGWSQRKIAMFADRPDKFFNASTNFKTRTNKFGGTYAFYYDLGRKVMMDQRIVGYYNAQCCGVVVEYQQYNFPQYSAYAVPQDHRFNIGFTLAGLGTFSNFLGAFGGNTGQSGGFGGRSF